MLCVSDKSYVKCKRRRRLQLYFIHIKAELQLDSSLPTHLTARQGQVPASGEIVIRATNDTTKD